jgi:Rrf2 family protein
MRLELTKRGDYAVRAMVALHRAKGEQLSGPQIAERMGIPVRFLPQVMGDLVRAGLVGSQTGRAGGYHLGRPETEITILAIIEAVEGDARRRACVLRGIPCGSSGVCAVHEVFTRAQDRLLGDLGTATLDQIG